MVYASTKIKRTAAAAFEPETIETDEFSIEKPDGFLNVLNRDPALELDMYSKEFGNENASDKRQARVELRHYRVCKMSEAIAMIKERSTIKSDIAEMINERKYRLIEAERIENGIGFREIYKLTDDGPDVFELRSVVLEDASDEIANKAEAIVLSFSVK